MNQFVYTECHGILVAASSFFWVVHFPGMALITFSAVSRDMDYFAFVSHLSGRAPDLKCPVTSVGDVPGPHSLDY